MPDFVYLLIDFPALILIPVIALAALSLWSGSRTGWFATAVWLLYLLYELGMTFEILCAGKECLPRRELYTVYPILAFITLVAAVQIYVRHRDQKRLPPPTRPR